MATSLRADGLAFHRRTVRKRFGLSVLGHDHFLENALDAQPVLQHRRVLQVVMYVRLGGVARITALAQQLPALHIVAHLDDDAPPFEVERSTPCPDADLVEKITTAKTTTLGKNACMAKAFQKRRDGFVKFGKDLAALPAVLRSR